MNKQDYMKRAIDLANQGIGFVNPNPLVGAVIVKNGKIIGEGYHMCFGEAHAEVNAFSNATEDVEGAEMYVTLEPCSHYGKTPPCALKIIEKKIKKVYVSSKDPNPLVAGRGIELLKNAGIEVESGLLEDVSKKQNEVFLKYIQEKVPFVAMKYAMTLDGKIATSTKDSKWITNEKSRAFVHDLRNQYMGIMVGINTVVLDDPILNVRRSIPSRNPVRFIIDPNLRIPESSKIVQTAHEQKTYIITDLNADKTKISQLEKHGLKMILTSTKPNLDMKHLMKEIGALGIDSLIIEGGGYLHAKALEAGIVDKAYVFIAPKMIGGIEAPSPVGGTGIQLMKNAIKLKNITYQAFDQDFMIEGYISKEKDTQNI
jgi:diaminohydroxyphosphoribosylaminopyrimidine deaminase / 5-amino-6-(5-phosphoribosylamino)uracil reductase